MTKQKKGRQIKKQAAKRGGSVEERLSTLEDSVKANKRLAILAGVFAAVLGNTLGYLLGRWGGRLVLGKAAVSEARMQRVESLFNRYGGGIVFAGRFVDGLRQLNGIVAGALEMPWWKFTVFNVLGAVIWTLLWGLGVFFLDKDIKNVYAVFHVIEPYLIVVSLLAVIVLVLYLRRGRKSADAG